MKTRFTPEGDHIVVDGGKTFITNGDMADLLLLFGKWSEIDDARGSDLGAGRREGHAGFQRRAPGRQDGPARLQHGGARLRQGCRVPRANLLGKPGDGLKILLASLNKSRPERRRARARHRARRVRGHDRPTSTQRRQSGRRIVEFQGIQFMLADLATELALCEAWLDHVADLVDGGAADFGVEASMPSCAPPTSPCA